MVNGRKILLVLPPKDFRDEEFLEPKQILEEAGYFLEITAKSTATTVGVGGTKVNTTVPFDQITAPSYVAVVFVGGPGSAVYLNDSQVQELAQTFLRENKVVAAICLAPSILANAGILKGQKATVFSSEKSNLEAKGAVYTGESVTVAGKIITANGPAAAKAFGEKIRDLLQE